MVYKKSAGANNNRNYMLYVFIFFITVLTIVTFSSYNIESYSVSLSTEDNQSIDLNSIETKKIQVGDIDVAYKMLGNGSPILLINGFSASLNFWDPTLISRLASNHTVITFDNRGIGNTTSGNKQFSIQQFADGTSRLMEALKIKKTDVMGWSMGGMIAQEVALSNPDKVGKLIIYASTCGTNQSVAPSPEVVDIFSNQSGNMMEMLQRFLPLLFPDHWRNSNPNFIQELPKSSEVAPIETLKLQTQAIINWTGTCDRLGSITQPALVLVGTDDVLTVPANSILMAEKIPGSWLVQIKGGGHAMMIQYPGKFTNIVDTFLHS
jgi:pimeloyl-ACP methyl ester carboxylesterase